MDFFIVILNWSFSLKFKVFLATIWKGNFSVAIKGENNVKAPFPSFAVSLLLLKHVYSFSYFLLVLVRTFWQPSGRAASVAIKEENNINAQHCCCYWQLPLLHILLSLLFTFTLLQILIFPFYPFLCFIILLQS